MRIYISSTYSDLHECREQVYRTLRQLGHDVIAMEDYVATDQRPLDKCLQDVASCDLYVGIFAWRYGYIPKHGNPKKLSITECEFRHAVSTGKACLLFLLDEDAAWPRSQVERGRGAKRIETFRMQLSTAYTVSFFQNSDDLARLVSVAVAKAISPLPPRSQRPPWQPPKRALAEKFFGRATLLAQLVERLQRRESVDIWGLAGMGKTALAAEAIHTVVGDNQDMLSTTPYPDGVVLLDLYSRKFTSPDPAWNHLTESFDASLLTTNVTARERAMAACRGRRALVVVEGAEEAGDGQTLKELLKVLAPETTRLVLTRDKRQVSTAKPLDVEAPLADNEALALLRELCGHVTDDATLVRVHERLGGHPLALTWAGLQINAREESPRAFVAALTAAALPNLHEPSYEDHTLRWLYDRSVIRLTPAGQGVLAAVGLLAQQPFPLSAAMAVLQTQEAPAREALKSLVRYGLLRITSSEEDYWEFTHALAHQFAHSNADLTVLTTFGLWAEQEFDRAVAVVRDHSDFSRLSQVLNHARALLRADRDATALAALQFKLLYNGLDQINTLGRLDLARTASVAVHEWLQRGVALRPDDVALQRELSASHDRVGDVLMAQGQGGEALAAYTASRTIRERLAGHDPANTAWQRDLVVSHAMLGSALAQQGQRAEALASFAQARAISARLVQHDPNNAVWKNDLAWVEQRITELG